MSDRAKPRLYSDLARWWPLVSPPEHYVEEAADLIPLLQEGLDDSSKPTLLELGAGGGSLASHLKPHFSLTLTDRSPEMLANSQRVNPECEHIVGDMRSLDLGREFDRVLIHDAIMYAVRPSDVQAALATAARHCRTGGRLVVIPDCVRETFKPQTDWGGEDATDGRALRYLEWSWDPDPSDDTFETAYAFLMREADGSVTVELDRHRIGCFPRADWLAWLEAAGFRTRIHTDPWRADVFIGDKTGEPGNLGAREPGNPGTPEPV
jgi:SAM-dependent methyltransferase